jgi:hypothetical protein
MELVKLDSSASSIASRMGAKHPDRTVEYTSAKVMAALAPQRPATSIDTKKKELIGNFKDSGADCRPKGKPRA